MIPSDRAARARLTSHGVESLPSGVRSVAEDRAQLHQLRRRSHHQRAISLPSRLEGALLDEQHRSPARVLLLSSSRLHSLSLSLLHVHSPARYCRPPLTPRRHRPACGSFDWRSQTTSANERASEGRPTTSEGDRQTTTARDHSTDTTRRHLEASSKVSHCALDSCAGAIGWSVAATA
jgi:hypothetical protein